MPPFDMLIRVERKQHKAVQAELDMYFDDVYAEDFQIRRSCIFGAIGDPHQVKVVY